MAGTTTRVTIYDFQVDSLFAAGGDVYDWMRDVGTEHLRMALIEAPSRSGQLRSMHNLALTPEPFSRHVRYSVGNYADYAGWVHNGTKQNGAGYIYPGNGDGFAYWDDGKMAYLGPMESVGWKGAALYAPRVHGQEANPWIRRAGQIVLARYGYIGGDLPGD